MKLFDFNPGSPKDRAQARHIATNPPKKKKRGKGYQSAEDIMPFSSIDGHILRCVDKSNIVYLTYPGENLALQDTRQQIDYATKNARVLSGVTADVVGIWCFPQETAVRGNLMIIDDRINELHRLISRTNDPDKIKVYEEYLHICQDCMRPDMQRQAVSDEYNTYQTYIGFKFFYATDKEIMIAVSAFSSALEREIGRKPHLLGEYEIRGLIDLFIKGKMPINSYLGDYVIMPEV